MPEVNSVCARVQEYLDMTYRPVGVKLIMPGEALQDGRYDEITGPQTFCRFVHDAAKGHNYLVTADNLDCKHALAALGLGEAGTAIEPRLKQKIGALRVGPVENADVLLLVVNAEQAMMLTHIVADIRVSTARSRTVCGQGVASVYNDKKPVISFLCLGARTRGGFNKHELLASFPYAVFLTLPLKMNKLAAFSKAMGDAIKKKILRIR